jgi:hypothetical protein
MYCALRGAEKAKLNERYAKFSTFKCNFNVTTPFTAEVMPSALTESSFKYFKSYNLIQILFAADVSTNSHVSLIDSCKKFSINSALTITARNLH